MIKIVKIGGLVYQGMEPFYIDENGNKVWNIPNDLETLRSYVIDTFNWLIGQEVKKQSGGDFTKLSAGNSKAIVLLLKLIDTLNPDESNLTDTEKNILNKLRIFKQQGYSDSPMLDSMLESVLNNISLYSKKIGQAQQAESIDELIKLLEE